MTVAVASPVNNFIGTGGASSYPFTFPVFTSSQITATVTNPTTGIVTSLTQGVDYNVTGLNPAGTPATTGNVSLINASQSWLTGGNLTTAWTLSVSRILALAQTYSIRNQGDFYRWFLEDALDTLIMIIQQQQAQLNNLLTTPGSANLIVGGVLTLADTKNGHVYKLVATNGLIQLVPLS